LELISELISYPVGLGLFVEMPITVLAKTVVDDTEPGRAGAPWSDFEGGKNGRFRFPKLIVEGKRAGLPD